MLVSQDFVRKIQFIIELAREKNKFAQETNDVVKLCSEEDEEFSPRREKYEMAREKLENYMKTLSREEIAAVEAAMWMGRDILLMKRPCETFEEAFIRAYEGLVSELFQKLAIDYMISKRLLAEYLEAAIEYMHGEI